MNYSSSVPKGRVMTRLLSFAIITAALLLPACAGTPEPETPPPPPPEPVYIPPPPPPVVDVLPEFKKSSRAFLDLAIKLDASAKSSPPPTYQTFWKEFEPLEEVYAKVIGSEPKSGPGANAFDRVNKIRDSLFQSRVILKNKDGLKQAQVVSLL